MLPDLGNKTIGLAALGLVVAASAPIATAGELSPAETKALTEEAYIYGLPLVMSYKTMYFYAVDAKSPEYKAPFNHLLNEARVYTPADKAVVSPNSDTPYSLMWMDLRAEPVVLCVPEIEKKRYYSIQLQDLNTYNFGYIGSRTTGNGGGCFLISGPDWRGETPTGINKAFRSGAGYAMTIYRTQLFNPADLDNVKRIQAGYKVQLLSKFLGKTAPASPAAPKFQAWDEKGATGKDFIAYLNFLLQYVSPDAKEKALWDRLAKLGIGVGKPFDYAKLSADQQKAIEGGVKAAVAKIAAKGKTTAIAGGDRAHYNADWLLRSAVTEVGWGANDAEEASYPVYRTDAGGVALDGGKHAYTLTYPKGGLPPVKAFWSLTMYDAKTQLMIDNPIKRYLINTPMLPDLKKNADGSLTLYVQKKSPGKDKESNWLPAPDGPFYIINRLYWPSKEILDGKWKGPAMKKVK
jgi:hypothetical protein